MRRRVVADSVDMDSHNLSQRRQFMKKSEVKLKLVDEGCSCYHPEVPAPHGFFESAWKAIEDGATSTLEQTIQEMKKSEGGSSALLDTCRLMEKSGVTYSMSLLALCGFHGKIEMVDLLLKEGADMNAKCACKMHTGTPVFQMMLHCRIQVDYDKLSVTMLEYIIEKGASLRGKISTRHVDLDRYTGGGVSCAMLDLTLSIKRIDCAKVLVKAGVDLINGGCPGGEKFDVVPMFQEYKDHGTNEFIRWAFNEYIPNHPEIDLKRIIESIINMKKKDEKSCFWKFVQRAPAHAILTSHHEETIKRLVQCGKENGLDLLTERTCTGKTALHIAAEENDVESVCILLKLGADTRASDNSDMNPFMLAIEKCHSDVVRIMMEKDPDLMSMPMGSRSTVIHWALEKGCHRSSFFECCFEENPMALLTARDSQGNTIAHLVAASGNTEVFKILWSMEFVEAVFSDQNLENKTPLQLAVEREHVNILKTLNSCVGTGREAIPPQWLRKLKTEWWDKMVPYFLLASSCGSLDAVEYFIASGQEPTVSQNDKTPLLCAAEAGHDDIVAYLLQFRKVRTDLQNQPGKVYSASVSPLLIAARNGHTKCVTLLLQNGGDVLQRDYKNRNCLMLAIQYHHRDTALAILSEKDGLMALKIPTPLRLLTRRNKKPTPLHLMVKEMPDLAEYVLNKCITQEQKGSHTETENQPVKFNFDFLEDEIPHDHILVWMKEHKRLQLLQHPLVENFLFQNFWLKVFPLLLLNLMFYLIFLVVLNSFALVVPRPGPDSETCASSRCQGHAEGDWKFLAATAIFLYMLSLIGFMVEVFQFWMRGWRYFNDSDNYFQLALYTLTIIFIHGFHNECWCSTHGQWQIGVSAVFLSWFNFIFAFKYMPYTDIPINMFSSIFFRFLKTIYLKIGLILVSGVPFYMVFFQTRELGSLLTFESLSHAVSGIFHELAKELGIETSTNQDTLLSSPATYLVFITFLFLLIKYLNKTREDPEFTTLKLWVKFILEQGEMKGLYMYYIPQNRFINYFMKVFGKDYARHAEIAKKLQKRNKNIYSMVMAQNPVREDISKLKEDFGTFKQEMMAQNPVREDISKLKEDFGTFKQEMMAQITPVDAVRDDIAKLKEDLAKLVQALTPSGGN